MTLGTMPNDLSHHSDLSGTWTLNPNIANKYGRNVYENGEYCMYWYGPAQKWLFNECTSVGEGAR